MPRGTVPVIIGLFAMASTATPSPISVHVFPDSTSAGWAHKTRDIAFVAGSADCVVRWNAITLKSGDSLLEVRRDCEHPFDRQAPLHRAIAAEIDRRYGFGDFSGLAWGAFAHGSDLSWNEKIVAGFRDRALADTPSASDDNAAFVRMANDVRPFEPLAAILARHGVGMRLEAVEKVFAARPADLPGSLAQSAAGLPAHRRIPFDVGSSHFRLEPLPTATTTSSDSTAEGNPAHP